MTDEPTRLSSTLVFDVQKATISDRPFTSLSRPSCACLWESAYWTLEPRKPKEKP